MDIFKKAKAISWHEILRKAGIKVTDRGRYLLFLCPFHGDKSIGSSKVDLSKDRYYCNVCNHTKLDKISFVQELNSMTAIEAASWILGDIDVVNFNPAPVKKTVKKTKASADLMHTVYELFVSACSPLTEDQLDVLASRKVPQSWHGWFFNFPGYNDKYPVLNQVIAGLDHLGITQEDASHVPGFYLKDGKLEFSAQECLGIIQRDNNGRISALQQRMLNPVNGSKYKLFSSGWTETGVSIGTVPNIIPSQKNRAFAITEGLFKGLWLANKFGYKTLSLNGVNTYHGLLDPEMMDGYDECILFYDADWQTNPCVYQAMVGLIQKVKELNLFKEIYVALWDIDMGKGIDDVIGNGHTMDIIRMTADQVLEEAIAG